MKRGASGSLKKEGPTERLSVLFSLFHLKIEAKYSIRNVV
jgi:hypothetical protein